MKSSAAQNKTPVNNRKKENKWIKPVCITAVVLAIAIAAAVILPNVLGSKEESTRITTYNISKVTYDNITQTISGSGTVSPVTSETLTSTKGGEVTKVNFTVGDEVAENDVIAVINGENIVAPCDGVLLELPLNVGDEVAQGGSVAMVMGKDGFTMGIAVDETEISSVKLDQEVTFTIDAVSSDFTGKVTKISYNGSSSGGSVAYQITAAFDYAEGIYPGMSATAQIVIEDSGEGLMVPVDAITTSGDNNYVYLAPAGAEEGAVYEEDKLDLSTLTKVSVKTGMSDGSYILVESDELEEGDLIVVTKVTSTQTGSDKESDRSGFPGGMSGMPNMPGGMDFGDFDFDSFDPGQRPEGGFGGGSYSGGGGFGGFGN